MERGKIRGGGVRPGGQGLPLPAAFLRRGGYWERGG